MNKCQFFCFSTILITDKMQWLTSWVTETVLLIIAQSWPWGSQITTKQKKIGLNFNPSMKQKKIISSFFFLTRLISLTYVTNIVVLKKKLLSHLKIAFFRKKDPKQGAAWTMPKSKFDMIWKGNKKEIISFQ